VKDVDRIYTKANLVPLKAEFLLQNKLVKYPFIGALGINGTNLGSDT